MLNTEYLHFQVLVDVWLQNIKLEGKLSQGPVWVWESFSGGEGWGLGGGGEAQVTRTHWISVQLFSPPVLGKVKTKSQEL